MTSRLQEDNWSVSNVPKGVKIDFSVLEHLMKGTQGEEEKTILQDLLAKEKERVAEQKLHISPEFDPSQLGWTLQEVAHREKKSRGELIQLVQEMIQTEFGLDEKTMPKISFKFGNKDGIAQPPIDASTYQNTYTISSDLTPTEKATLEQEQQVRHLQNLLITWSGQRAFQLLDKYKNQIDTIDPNLFQEYHDLITTQLDHLHRSDPNTLWPRYNTGISKLIVSSQGIKLHIEADIFPVLAHEMMKGVTEYLSMNRYNGISEEMKTAILSVDEYQDEHRQMLIWGQLWRQLYFCIQEATYEVADTEGLIDGKTPKQYFVPIYQRINQLPAQEYLAFIKMLTDGGDGKNAIGRIKQIIETLQEEYQAYQAQLQATKQKIYTQADIEKSLQAKRSPECQVFLTQYQSQLTGKLKEYYPSSLAPKAIERSIITKIEKYFANGTVGAVMEELPIEGPNTETLDENKQQQETEKISKLQWQALYDHIVEVVVELQKELLRVSALKELYNEKRTKLKGQGGKGKEQVVYTIKDIEHAEEKLSRNPSFAQQVSTRIQEYSILKLFQDHKMHTGLINELYAKLISLDDLKPEFVHDFGEYQLYNLRTADQLIDEWLEKNLWHCVSGQASNVANGSVVIWSVRSNNHKNPLNLQTNAFYTIWYNPSSRTIIQRKWYENKTVTSHDGNKNEMLEILTWLCKNYKIQSVNDRWSVIQDDEILRDDMTVTDSDNDNSVINKLMDGKIPLLNRPTKLSIPYNLSIVDVNEICKLSWYAFDLTFLEQKQKNQLEYIAGSLVDNNTSISYPNLGKVDWRVDIREAESHSVVFPSLESVKGCIYKARETTYLLDWKEKELPEAPALIQAQQSAMREIWWEDNELYNGCDMLRAQWFITYEKDSQGDWCTRFPILGLSVRHEYLRSDKMKQWDYYDWKNDYKTYTDSYLLSDESLKGHRDCIYKNTIDRQKQARKNAMDEDCYNKGYMRQKKSQLDVILSALAGQLGISYNPNSTDEQEVVKAYMYLRGALGREWMNTEYETWKEWDKYWQGENSIFGSRWVLFCNNHYQRIYRVDGDDNDCSIPLIRLTW